MNELQIGKAGEYLVCFDLITKGYIAFLSEQGLPFDVVVTDDLGNLYKIQVKTSVKLKNNKCHFDISHGKIVKGRKKKAYFKKDVDIMAFVCIETKQIAYLAIENCKAVAQFYSKTESNSSSILEKNLNLALSEIQKGNKDLKALSEKYQLSLYTLEKYKKHKEYKSRYSNMKYFDNFGIEKILPLSEIGNQ